MNLAYYFTLIFGSLALMVSAVQPSGGDVPTLGESSSGIKLFEQHTETINSLFHSELEQVATMLLKLPTNFNVSINPILETHGFALKTNDAAPDLLLHRRGFWFDFKEVIRNICRAINLAGKIITIFEPEFAPVVAVTGLIVAYMP
ncbi:hypothetical protein JCM33374_g610 [Metschnikowia sp. JCM 33374]|nr:hypothetical protein JCM33374_g610 [Metschnikowia sp. JCM 33374]